MTSIKEIKNKINSVSNTQKITRAMEMVSASKMRKAQDQMIKGRPYTSKIRQVIHHLALGHLEYKHPYVEQREIKKVAYLVIGTDRGLCGGLNNNLFRIVIEKIHADIKAGREVELFLIGRKAEQFFKGLNLEIVAVKTGIGHTTTVSDVVGVVKVMIDRFNGKKNDRLYLSYNDFINTMNQNPVVEQLVPLQKTEEKEYSHYWDYIYEPSSKELIDPLLTRYVEALVYQGMVENIASEQAARMVAMKSATDNAKEVINRFQLIYNKERQAAITKEISEIVGGAAAI